MGKVLKMSPKIVSIVAIALLYASLSLIKHFIGHRAYIPNTISQKTNLGSFINHVDRFLDIFDPPSPFVVKVYL